MIWIFLVSSLLVVYAMIGWPLLLHLHAKLRCRAGRREFRPRTVTAIIAVHNGERYLAAKLDSLLALNYPRDLLDVIVASDGSTDGTESIAASYPKVRLVTVPRGGKCRALNAALRHATGEIVLFTDVRQTLDPESLRRMVERFADSEVGVVSGDIALHAGSLGGAGDVGLFRKLETWIRIRLSEIDSMFGATGALYAIRRELAPTVPEEILLDDMFIPIATFFRGYRTVMEPGAIAWDVPTSRTDEFPRKVRTLAGNYQLFRHYPRLLIPFANRMWLHFVSYKVARLALPWLLLAVFVSSFFLPVPWNAVVAAAQIAFLLLVLFDSWTAEGSAPKRLTSPARTFFTMMLAAALALRILFVDARSLWTVTNVKKSA